jgi:putative Mn2+ efflux pump MntP
MSFITITVIALGLAMDAFAVSITSGITLKDLRISNAVTIALFFGSFQAFMPVIGWLAGLYVRAFIMGIDHWIAFVLLSLIGCKMIFELGPEGKELDPLNIPVLLVLAIATSIDALAVGLSLSFLNIAIVTPALIIGATTFSLSFLGVFLGNISGHFFENKIEIIGGLILIGIGTKILVEHIILNVA